MPLLMHRIGHAYGVLPSSLLRLSPEEMGINRVCLEAGDDDDHSRLERMKGVQPVFVVASRG